MPVPHVPDPWWLVEPADTARGGAPWREIQSAAKPKTGGSTGLAAVKGPYATKAEADKALARLQDPGKIARDLNPLPSLGDFLGRLTQANTWIRAGEVVLGIVLIGIGLARITGAQNLVSQAVKTKLPV